MNDDFKFSTRKEYEDEVKRLLFEIKKHARKNKKENFEEQYDLLIEEYVRFCEETK
jgi:hypothetical protein